MPTLLVKNFPCLNVTIYIYIFLINLAILFISLVKKVESQVLVLTMDLVDLFPLILISVLSNVVEGTQYRGSRNLKIVGGRYARQGQFPHLVSLQLVRRGGNPRVHFCGGSILQSSHLVTHSVHVLTAAHCCEHVFNNRLLEISINTSVTHYIVL